MLRRLRMNTGSVGLDGIQGLLLSIKTETISPKIFNAIMFSVLLWSAVFPLGIQICYPVKFKSEICSLIGWSLKDFDFSTSFVARVNRLLSSSTRCLILPTWHRRRYICVRETGRGLAEVDRRYGSIAVGKKKKYKKSDCNNNSNIHYMTAMVTELAQGIFKKTIKTFHLSKELNVACHWHLTVHRLKRKKNDFQKYWRQCHRLKYIFMIDLNNFIYNRQILKDFWSKTMIPKRSSLKNKSIKKLYCFCPLLTSWLE